MTIGDMVQQRADAGDRHAARLLEQVARESARPASAPDQPPEDHLRNRTSRNRASVQLETLLIGLAGARRIERAVIAQVQAECLVDTLVGLGDRHSAAAALRALADSIAPQEEL